MCQGSTVHTINGDRIELKTGELLILNQNAVQEIEPAGRDDIAVNFLILPEFFDQTLRMIGTEENQLKDFIVGCLKSREVPLCYLHYRIADVLPVQNLIETSSGRSYITRAISGASIRLRWAFYSCSS